MICDGKILMRERLALFKLFPGVLVAVSRKRMTIARESVPHSLGESPRSYTGDGNINGLGRVLVLLPVVVIAL